MRHRAQSATSFDIQTIVEIARRAGAVGQHQSGIDMLVWGVNTQSGFLAVQCKEFGVKEHELGDDQIRQSKIRSTDYEEWSSS